MPLVTSQPQNHDDVAPSVIETNAISLTAQQEWEMEWNQQGLASRLSPEVHVHFKDYERPLSTFESDVILFFPPSNCKVLIIVSIQTLIGI